jgi:hypothetical protein
VTDLPVIRAAIALARTWPGRFILAFLAIQLVAPLHYYCVRRDRHDERFAWRMFSPMRGAACVPHVEIDGAPFALQSKFHQAWRTLAERGRFVVVEAMGAELCRAHPGADVEVSLDCKYIDGESHRWGGYNICTVPLLYGE